MIKSLGKNWILTDFPLTLAQVGWGILVLTIALTSTKTTSAQTRKSAASIPYNYSEQSNSFPDRPNPIRLVQAEMEVPSLANWDDDPFAPVDDLNLLSPDLVESGMTQDEVYYPDIPDNVLAPSEYDNQTTILPGYRSDEDDEEEVVELTLPGLQQNTEPGRSTRSPFAIPKNVNIDEAIGGRKHPDEAAIKDWLEEQGKLESIEILTPPDKPTLPKKQLEKPVKPEPTSPTIEEPATDLSDYGKPQAKSTKRFFRDCNVGRDMMFADQYGYPIEIAPFAGFFIEKPCAPLFDFGGSGIDFFGYQRHCPPVRPCGWLFDNMEVFAGTSGFGLRSDDIEETSFALHEGINWSGSVSPRFGLAAQFGIRAVQRTIDGTNPFFGEEETKWNGNKSQVFITTGLFKRAQSRPLQYGVVYDWMSDSVYRNRQMGEKNLDTFDLGQLRTELSYRCCSGFTWGFRGTFGSTQYDLFSQAPYRTKATTQLHGFFEKPFWCGSLAGFSAGGTPKGNAILAAYYDQPLRDKFSLKAGFTYMLPQNAREKNGIPIDERNAWEAAITLTFHPHGGAFSKNCNPLRAMFDVAGNGSMIVSHKK